MTEEEAKTKWCPQARFTGTPSDDLVPNRSEPLEDATRCIASACMAWRVAYDWVEKYDNGLPITSRVEIGGYCGLAGAPQ